MRNSCVARQPIYDAHLSCVGYELLYRPAGANAARFDSGIDASAQVIINTFIHIGIDNLVGSARAFINVPEALLVDDAMLPMFHEQTVLEVARDVQPTPAVLAGLRRLKQRGFAIALDNFEFRPELRPLLELADYVKFDVLSLGPEVLAREMGALRYAGIHTVAQRVETVEALVQCRELGFELFQGYFFCKPQVLKETHTRANRAVVLNLLQRLADPELPNAELEAALAGDVSLSYKLLRYANSAAFGLRREITSLRDAILLVGVNTIRNWASLILLDSVRSKKPQELVRVAMVRAAMCERLAKRGLPNLRAQAFVTGLFSVLDALMDTPMVRLLDDLALSADVKLALLDRTGELGALLNQTLRYEAGDWPSLVAEQADLDALTESYKEAVRWADENAKNLFG